MFGRQPESSVEEVAAVAAFLREPQSRARHLLAANKKWLRGLENRRNTRLAGADLRRYTARLRFPQLRNLQQLLRDDPRSRLLVTYHFGDYLYGPNLLAARIGAQTKVCFLAQAAGSDAYFANMKRAFGGRAMGPREQLLARDAQIGKLAPLLRRPGTQLITFCDLNEHFGGRARVEFLFRNAWFSRGPALLSLTNRVPLLPLINWTENGRAQVVLGNQMEPERFGGETLTAAAERITSGLVRFFEPFFRFSPEQWRYLSILPLYFIESGPADHPQPTEKTHANPQQNAAIGHPLFRSSRPGGN